MKKVDLREVITLAIYVAIVLAVLRFAVSKIPGPVGRLGAYL